MRRNLRRPLPEVVPPQGFAVQPRSAERVEDFYQSYFELLNRRSVLLKPVQALA